MKDLRIEQIGAYREGRKQGYSLIFNDDTEQDFKIKRNATPKEFIKHLRSMIYHIEKRVEENE